MNTTIAKMALEWLRAEHNAAVARGDFSYDFEASSDDVCVASDRVYQVMAGEVRWSEAGPGDKAIWKGRMRDVERFEQLWRDSGSPAANLQGALARQEADAANYPSTVPSSMMSRAGVRRPGPRLQGYRERLWANYYDTVPFAPYQHEQPRKMFDGQVQLRIGNYFLTNLLQPGILASDQTTIITAYYVSLSSLDALRWAADNVIALVGIGDKPQHGGPMFVRDLFMGVVPLRPAIVPVRQRVWVVVEQREAVPSDIKPFELTFHMDCVVSRDVA